MSELKVSEQAVNSSAARADELFKQHRQEIFRKTDKLFARLMVFQWLAGILMAVLIAPHTWNGQTSGIHIHVWASIFIGGAITIFPVWMTYVWPGATITRHVIAVAQMLMSALLISLTGGRIETHFHVFGSLVILSFYRDWRVLIPATVVVALDHFLRGIYWPYSVYGVLTASPWRSVEHAGWVVFEDVFLVISCLRSIREMRFIANRTAALETASHANQLIMDNSQDVICTIDEHGRFLTVNAASENLWGFTPSELVGRQYLDLVYSEDRPKTNQAEAKTRVTGKISDFVNRYVRKDGTLVDVLWSAYWSNADKTFFCVAHDVTDRQKSEKALREAKEEADRANRAKSEFLSRMSHELRTPLNAILGFSQLLERQNPTEKQRGRIGHIVGAGRHLLDLINEVLDISRIEAGRLPVSLEPVGLDDALAEAIDLMRPLAAERSIDLTAPDKIDSQSYVMADRQRFKQVLLNLLTNAVKYTPISGRVTISCGELGKDKLRVVVSDTGAGIPAEKLSRLFTPFDRLGAEQSDVQGTGLGLPLSQRLIHAMGGTIGVSSDAGHGSTFWVELPRAASPLQGISARKKARVFKHNGAAPAKKRKLLYIEDNLSNLTLVEQILDEQPDIELMTAMQGKIGLDLARRHAPDLILLDLHLPDIQGWEVLEQLKASDQTRHIPTIVISADATSRQIERLMSAGALDYLTKPLDMDRFVRALEKNATRTDSSAEPATV